MTAKATKNGEKQEKQEKQEKTGFEERMLRLEKIVAEMEEGELTLEQMIARFEEGRGLIKNCTKTLNEVERKIEMLVKQGDEVVAVPFEDDQADRSV